MTHSYLLDTPIHFVVFMLQRVTQPVSLEGNRFVEKDDLNRSMKVDMSV